jgi:hypothetical protein
MYTYFGYVVCTMDLQYCEEVRLWVACGLWLSVVIIYLRQFEIEINDKPTYIILT